MLTPKQWRIIAKALKFVRDMCGEPNADEILEVIGTEGEKAADVSGEPQAIEAGEMLPSDT